MNKWHIWTIAPQRHKKVKEFLSGLNGIEEYLYPTVEQKTKSGKKIKTVPLYNNYIFIKYETVPEIETQLSNFPWLKDYLGKCGKDEIAKVKELTDQKYEDVIRSDSITVGETYKLMDTPFKGMLCRVIDRDGEKLTVSVEIFGSDRLIKCSIYDIELG